MKKSFDFWALFDGPVVQSIAFALWGVPLYILLQQIPVLVAKWAPTSSFADIISGILRITTVNELDQANIANFIEWFGVPYGLILALVLVNVWTQFDTTERAFDREADTIYTLFHTCHFLSSKLLKIEIYKKLLAYIDMVLAKPEVEEDKDSEEENIQDKTLKDIYKSVEETINDKNEHDLAMKILELMNEVLDDRGDRKSYASQRIPHPVRYLSVIASIVWLVPFYALRFNNPLIGPFFIVSVTWVVVSVLLIIEDLDNPIGGTWEIKFKSWERLKKEIKREHDLLVKEVEKIYKFQEWE